MLMEWLAEASQYAINVIILYALVSWAMLKIRSSLRVKWL